MDISKLIYPPVCALCYEKESLYRGGLCDQCLSEIKFHPDNCCHSCGGEIDTVLNSCRECALNPPPWEAGTSALQFQGLSREAIHLFKYNARLALARFLIDEMNGALRESPIADIKTVTFVPMHWTKVIHRGYNQAQILAEGIASELNIPCRKLLYRCSWRSPQALKSKAERRRNIIKLFETVKNENIPDGAILLIDDVMTTGATLTACSRKLLEAGAGRIYILTAARG